MPENNATPLQHSLMSRLKLRHLALLRALNEQRLMSRVAMTLGLSQPAVTKALREIEEIFMARLFERTGRGLRPTLAGQAVLQYAQLALADLDAVARTLVAIDAGLLGRVRIGLIPDIPVHLLDAALNHLSNEAPGVAAVVREGDSIDLVAALSARELDCVIGRAHHLGEEIVQRTVLHQTPCLLVSAKCRGRLARKLPLSWEQLATLTWIMQPVGSTGRQTVEGLFIAAGVQPPTPSVETHSLKAIEALLRTQQNGACILAKDVALELTRSGGCAILPQAFDWTLPPISFFMTRDTSRQHLVQQLCVAVQNAALARPK